MIDSTSTLLFKRTSLLFSWGLVAWCCKSSRQKLWVGLPSEHYNRCTHFFLLLFPFRAFHFSKIKNKQPRPLLSPPMDDAFNSGPKLVSEFGEQASDQEQKQNQNQRAEVDTSAPFESVMEAVTRFGGVGFWKPRTRNPSQPSQANGEEAFDGARVEDQATQSQNDVASEERETGEILKEIEATKTRFEELKVKLQKEVKVNTHAPPDDQNNNGNTAKVQVDEVELSKTEILKKVEEATKEVKTCTRVLEEALSRVEAARQDSCGMHPDCNLLLTGPTMSIGQILNRKLALAREHTEKSPPTWKVSLAQMLNKSSNGEKRGGGGGGKGVPPKRMKFGFGGISFLVAKPSTKKTKKQSR